MADIVKPVHVNQQNNPQVQAPKPNPAPVQMSPQAQSLSMAKQMNNPNAPADGNYVRGMNELSQEQLELLTREIILPSKGQLYNGLIPEGKIRIRMMKVADTKLLFNNNIPQHERLNLLVQKVLMNCNLAVEQLLMVDKFYIIIQSRILSLGDDYKYTITCPSCNHTNVIKMKLSEMEVRELKDAGEPYVFQLPTANRRIYLKHMRVSDEVSSVTYLNSLKVKAEREGRKVGDEELISYTLACQVHAIDGVTDDMSSKLDYINNMVSRDYEAIQNFLKSKDFGVTMELLKSCNKCLYDIYHSLPFDVEFFRPRITGESAHTE